MREWLKDCRINKNLSQADVATKIGVTQTCYWFYENGKRRPPVETAKKLGEILGFKWTKFYS